MTIGCVYICEEDAVQGALLLNLQKNLRSISLVVAAVTLVMSLFFAQMLSSRFTALLSAIRIVGEGEYGHRLQPSGRDELALLAEEFNQLTDRLQTTEEVRRRFVSDALPRAEDPSGLHPGMPGRLHSPERDHGPSDPAGLRFQTSGQRQTG